MEHREHGQGRLTGREWIEAVKRSAVAMKKAPDAGSRRSRAGLGVARESRILMSDNRRKVKVDWVQYHLKQQRDAYWTMTAEQTGVYIRLFHVSADGVPIPADDTLEAARRLQLNPRLYRRVLAALIKRGAVEHVDGCVVVPLGVAARQSASTNERRSGGAGQPQSTAIAMPVYPESTGIEVQSNGNLLPVGAEKPQQNQRSVPLFSSTVVSSNAYQEEDTELGRGYARTRGDEMYAEWSTDDHEHADIDDAI